MAKTTKRFENFDGVTIKVVSKSRGYSIIIKIEEGAYLWHDRRNENCAIKFIVPYSKRIATKSYKIKVNNQDYNHSKLGTPYRRNFDLPSGGTCLLYLAPLFFLTEELAEQCKDDLKEVCTVEQNPSKQLIFAPVTKRLQKQRRRPTEYEHVNV